MKTIDFYFDFISPYAYLANCRLPALAEKYGYAIDYFVIDLQAAKLAAGNTGPTSAQIPAKFRYANTDLLRWAKKYDVPFATPFAKPAGGSAAPPPEKVEFPRELFDSSRANKAAYFARGKGQERQYIDQMFANTFGSGALPGDEKVLRNTFSELGWDADEVFEFIQSEDAAQIYAQTNEGAQQRGVFGVPTMIVDGEMWWGNDRLDLLEEYLAQHGA